MEGGGFACRCLWDGTRLLSSIMDLQVPIDPGFNRAALSCSLISQQRGIYANVRVADPEDTGSGIKDCRLFYSGNWCFVESSGCLKEVKSSMPCLPPVLRR